MGSGESHVCSFLPVDISYLATHGADHPFIVLLVKRSRNHRRIKSQTHPLALEQILLIDNWRVNEVSRFISYEDGELC